MSMTEAMAKRKSKCNAALELLSDGRWHSARELTECSGWRYSARLHDLKKQGYVIERQTLDHQLYHYRLVPQGDLFSLASAAQEGK